MHEIKMLKLSRSTIKNHIPGIVIATIIIVIGLWYEKNIDTGYIRDVPNSDHVLIRAYALKDKSLLSLHRIAMNHFEKNEFNESAKIFERILVSSPNEPKIHFGLGVMQIYLKNFAGAETSFNNALKLKPKTAPALSGLAGVAAWRKEYRLSISLYKKALLDRPNFVTSHYWIAVQYYRIKEYELAEKHYEKVIKLIPNSQYARKSRNKLAKIELKKSIQLNGKKVNTGIF